MSNEELIRQRVQDFIRDHYEWNMKFEPEVERDDAGDEPWEAAKAALKELSVRHCTQDYSLGVSLGSEPDHHPEREKIISVEVLTSTSAVVETDYLKSSGGTTSYIYKLAILPDGWRITGISTLVSGRNDPLPEEPDLKVFTAGRLPPLPVKTIPQGLERLFEGPAKVNSMSGIRAAHCERIGEIEVPSGFLAYDDPSSWMFGAAVIEMPVPPGRYAVEIVKDDEAGRIAAARVVLNNAAKAATWVYATRWQKRDLPKDDSEREGTDLVGVDTGRVALADAGALMALSPRQREMLDQRLCGDRPTDIVSAPLSDSTQAVAFTSGAGDGVYPSYWALDDNSRPMAFYMDFLLLSRTVLQTITAPFSFGLLAKKATSPELSAAKIELKFARHEGRWALRVAGKDISQIVAKADDGRVLFDTKGLDSDVDEEDESIEIYMLPDDFPRKVSGQLSVQVVTGYQFELVS